MLRDLRESIDVSAAVFALILRSSGPLLVVDGGIVKLDLRLVE